MSQPPTPNEVELQALNNELAVLARERQRNARELARTAAELQQALDDRDRLYWHLRKLQEIMPVCMDCGAIRPNGKWIGVLDYLRENDILLTHGLCAGCSDRQMARLDAGPGSPAA